MRFLEKFSQPSHIVSDKTNHKTQNSNDIPAHLLTRRLTSPLFHVSLFYHSTKDFTAVQRDDGVTIQVKTEKSLFWQ